MKITFCMVLLLIYLCYGSEVDEEKEKILKEEKSLVSNKELKAISEQLFSYLNNYILKNIHINYQGRRTFNSTQDEAPKPLLYVPPNIYETTKTIRLMRKLFDNYDIDSRHEEVLTKEEEIEENNFIESLLNSRVIIKALDFLSSKGFFAKGLSAYKNVLKNIWFDVYSRDNHTRLGSSGFEHVFLVERKKGNQITGLHNWIFFANEEAAERLNYLGYVAKDEIEDKATVIKFYLSHLGRTKVSSMFIGTPPEFDIALYTLCFYARPNKSCKVTLGNVKITIQTYVQYSNDKRMLASSYPIIYRNKD